MSRWLQFIFVLLAATAAAHEQLLVRVSPPKVAGQKAVTFDYDQENQLTNVQVAGLWRSEFVYDGLFRRRVRREYTWSGGTWLRTNEVRYIYDGSLVLQERNSNNVAVVSYTRGLDLSGSMSGAGGIGGLLARSAGTNHVYYHTDELQPRRCRSGTSGARRAARIWSRVQIC